VCAPSVKSVGFQKWNYCSAATAIRFIMAPKLRQGRCGRQDCQGNAAAVHVKTARKYRRNGKTRRANEVTDGNDQPIPQDRRCGNLAAGQSRYDEVIAGEQPGSADNDDGETSEKTVPARTRMTAKLKAVSLATMRWYSVPKPMLPPATMASIKQGRTGRAVFLTPTVSIKV
jgi:hypothetical protein